MPDEGIVDQVFAQIPIAAVMDWFFREVWKS